MTLINWSEKVPVALRCLKCNISWYSGYKSPNAVVCICDECFKRHNINRGLYAPFKAIESLVVESRYIHSISASTVPGFNFLYRIEIKLYKSDPSSRSFNTIETIASCVGISGINVCRAMLASGHVHPRFIQYLDGVGRLYHGDHVPVVGCGILFLLDENYRDPRYIKTSYF